MPIPIEPTRTCHLLHLIHYSPHSASLFRTLTNTIMEYDQQAAPAPQKKKRDRYAAQAYEFGANAPNAAAQQPPGPAYGAFGAQPVGVASPQIGGPQMGGVPPVMGGGPAMPPVQQDPLAHQFGQMNIQGQPPMQQGAPPLQVPNANMNQLYPSDLINQPFQVSELDLPPPPIHLPPNTSVTPSPYANCPPKYVRSTLNCVPTTHSLLKKSKLPFALVISPYTSLHDDEDPVCCRQPVYMVVSLTSCRSQYAQIKSSQDVDAADHTSIPLLHSSIKAIGGDVTCAI